MNAATLRALVFLAVVLALGACDGVGGPVIVLDGGDDAGPEPDGGRDAGDTEAPRVVGSTPAPGSIDVARGDAIVIEFSEPMVREGTIAMSADGVSLTPTQAWGAGDTELSLTAALPPGARVRVVVERDFTDRAGNALVAPYVLELTTVDDVAPVVTSTTPAEGATGVSARISEVLFAFSEPMDATMGTIAIEGGPGAVVDTAWTLGGLVVRVSGLAYGTSYRLVPSGFADAAGNALDGTAYLGDGELDFTTGPDVDAPSVTDASPSEGQIEVRDTTATITLQFDEPMDTSVTSATLLVGAESVTVTGTWSAGGTRIDLDVEGILARNAAHSLSLAGFRDAAGNALDPVPHLADGSLDFVTGVDIFAPYVGFTDPVEGATDVSFRRDDVLVVFSEAMNTSRTTVEIDDGTTSFTATGVWSLAGTRFVIDVGGALSSTRSYAIDFSEFVDAGGTALDAEHAYLGDGVLEFTLGAPTGENCQDALTVAQGTSSGGVFEWIVAPGAFTDNDGGNTCPGANSSGVDGVIRYTKTTASASDGGTALRIFVDSAATRSNSWMSISVLRGECDPEVVALGPARLRCGDADDPHHVSVDVGPGDYYIWFSPHTGSVFDGATVRIEEVATVPEGESCLAPYDTSTSSAIYTAPASATDPHHWAIPLDAVQTMDHAVAYNGPGAMICDQDLGDETPDRNAGNDAVVELPKTSATSVGYVVLELPHTSYDVTAQLLDRCDTMDPGATSLFCEDDLKSSSTVRRMREILFDGPAGNRYLWLANDLSYNDFPGANVSYREIEPQPGDTCATAIPLTVGATNPVTPSRPHRLPAPSCFAATENVTWYRFTSTERFSHVTADGAANIAAIRAANGTQLGCQASAASAPLVTFVPVGTEVCVAVASGTPVTSLRVDAFAYDGNLGALTDLGIIASPSTSGSPRPLSTQTWIAATPTVIYQGVGSQGVLYAPLPGGVVADFRDENPVNDVLGNDAVAVGESIFIVDDADDPGLGRVHRLVNEGGMWAPAAWDVGSPYPEIGIDAITYDGTSLILATDWTASRPTGFYSLSPAAPGTSTLLGSTNLVRNVSGVAADGTYLYVIGQTDGTTATEGVFRISQADPTAAPVRLATIRINTTRASIEIDHLDTPRYLYFRAADDTVHVIADPAGAAPRHLGAIAAPGPATNETMTIDRTTGALYVFVHVGTSNSTFFRLD